jgi:hypothetical protein
VRQRDEKLGCGRKNNKYSAKTRQEDLKGAVINLIWHLKRQNYAEDTLYGYNLQALIELGIDLFDA